MPSPFIFLTAPLVMAFVIYFIRHWSRLAGYLGTGMVLVLIVGLLSVDLDPSSTGGLAGSLEGESWYVLGREVVLTSTIRTILLFLYGTLVLLFLISTVLPQGPVFVPFSLAILSPLTGAIMIRPLVFGAILLLIAAGLITILIQGIRAGSTLAASRYLAMMAIASSLLLMGGWIQESGQTAMNSTMATLFALSFIILLAGFPFQIWVAPMIGESRSLVPTIVMGIVHVLVVAFCLTLLRNSPAVQRSGQFWLTIRISGIIALLLSALFSLSARSVGRFLGYLVLINMSIVAITFSFLDRTTPDGVMVQLIARVPGLLIAGMGYGYIRYQLGAGIGTIDTVQSVKRLAWIAPFGTALVVYGGLTLLGIPLTVGFQGNWMAVELASTESFWISALIILAIVAGTLRLLQILSSALSSEAADGSVEKSLTVEMKAAAALVVGAALVLAFSPTLLINLAETMARIF